MQGWRIQKKSWDNGCLNAEIVGMILVGYCETGSASTRFVLIYSPPRLGPMLYTGGFTLSQSPTAKPPCYILFVELSVCQNCSAQNKPSDMASLLSHGSNASKYHETKYHLTGCIFCLYLDSQGLLSSLTSIFSFSLPYSQVYTPYQPVSWLTTQENQLFSRFTSCAEYSNSLMFQK